MKKLIINILPITSTANLSPIKKYLSLTNNLNIYSVDMLGKSAKKRKLKAPHKILKNFKKFT